MGCLSRQLKRRQIGTISVYGASDFSHFLNMAACLNHTTTSSYRCIVGLTKRSPGYDFRIWGQRFFPFFNMAACLNHTTTSSYRWYSGADEAFSRNSHTNTFTPQHQIPQLRQIQPHWRQQQHVTWPLYASLLVRLRYHDIRKSAVDPAHRIANTIVHHYAVAAHQ